MNALDKRLLNDFQRGFPLSSRPYAEIAARVDATEEDVIGALKRLQNSGHVARVGPVFAPGRLGSSTLAAVAVPEDRLEAVAAQISAYPEVNHNYEREHRLNLWFVVTAPDNDHLAAVISDMEARTRLKIMTLPLLTEYHIDLGFELDGP